MSCGCISTEYTKEPIAPNQKTKFRVFIDLRNQDGAFNKAVFIKSNAKNDVDLLRVVGQIYK